MKLNSELADLMVPPGHPSLVVLALVVLVLITPIAAVKAGQEVASSEHQELQHQEPQGGPENPPVVGTTKGQAYDWLAGKERADVTVAVNDPPETPIGPTTSSQSERKRQKPGNNRTSGRRRPGPRTPEGIHDLRRG